MPGVGSWPGGLVAVLLGPSLPAAHTVMTPSAASARWNLVVAEFGSNAPPPLGPYELLLTLMGGQPAHGLRWWSSTQFNALSAPKMLSPAPTDRLISVAPGAAPCRWVPSVRVVSRPATMPATWVPCPPADSVSVSLTAVRSAKHESFGNGSGSPRSVSGPQMFFMLSFTALEPSALRKNGWVPSTPVSMTAAETPRPSTGRPCPSRSWARACSPRVATFDVDRYRRIGWSPST